MCGSVAHFTTPKNMFNAFQRKSRTKRLPADLCSENFGIDDAMVVLENGVPDTYPQALRRLYADQLEMLAVTTLFFFEKHTWGETSLCLTPYDILLTFYPAYFLAFYLVLSL